MTKSVCAHGDGQQSTIRWRSHSCFGLSFLSDVQDARLGWISGHPVAPIANRYRVNSSSQTLFSSWSSSSTTSISKQPFVLRIVFERARETSSATRQITSDNKDDNNGRGLGSFLLLSQGAAASCPVFSSNDCFLHHHPDPHHASSPPLPFPFPGPYPSQLRIIPPHVTSDRPNHFCSCFDTEVQHPSPPSLLLSLVMLFRMRIFIW